MLDGEGMNYTLQSTSEYTYAAEGSSYHCSPETEWVEPGANTTNDTLQFKVTGLQVCLSVRGWVWLCMSLCAGLGVAVHVSLCGAGCGCACLSVRGWVWLCMSLCAGLGVLWGVL